MPELLKMLCDAHQSRDPTQTGNLRKAFRATAKLQLRQLRAAMRTAVTDYNVLGFGSAQGAQPTSTRLLAFSNWLDSTGRQYLIGPDWTRSYIQRAWRMGARKASQETSAPIGEDHSDAIITLAEIEIEGILSATVQQVSRTAAQIIARGTRRYQALRQLYRTFDKIAQPRLVVMADVLAIKAYNEAKLRTYQEAGVTHVGVQAESMPGATRMDAADRQSDPFEGITAEEEQLVGILTAGDDKVCELCQDWADDAPYEIDEVLDVYPLHPRCRCAVFPWEDLRFKGDDSINDKYDPNEPRDPKGSETGGRWTSGGAGEHPGKGYSASAKLVGDVIHTSNVYDAQRALFENRKVELKQIKQVSTLIQRLGETAREMLEHGEKAPVFNLCNVSIKGTNLFCAESKGIPRVKMPVIRAKKTKEFVEHLKSRGYKTEKSTERADHLRSTQDEIDGAKVASNMTRIDKEGFYKRIIVSRDDYILDGHHTWAGQLGVDARDGSLKGDKHVRITRVDISITKLLAEAETWTGGKGKKAAGQDAIDYDPNEPRDPKGSPTGGQWTKGGGGGGYEFVSPSVASGSQLAEAVKGLKSERQRALRAASHEVDSAFGIKGTRHDAIGAWSDGAEHTIVTTVDGNESWDKLRVSAAMKGHLADQKAVLVFKEGDGTSALYRMHTPEGDVQRLHENLIKDGLVFHTILPHTGVGGGTDVIVADLDGSAHDAMSKAAERYNADVFYETGQAEFIGTQREDGTDREQRDDARRAYEEVIQQSPVQESREIWTRLHHSWGETLGLAPAPAPAAKEPWGAAQGVVASRSITSKKSTFTGYARPDVEAMRSDPKNFEHDVGLFSEPRAYPNFRPDELRGTPEERVRTIIEHMKSNLRLLYDAASDEVKKSGTGWYAKAHDIAAADAKTYKIDERSAAGVIATLSPQKDWNQNIYLAHAVLEINGKQQNHQWDDKMAATAERIWIPKLKKNATELQQKKFPAKLEAARKQVAAVQGKKLSELTDPIDKAVWIRTYDEAHSTRAYSDFDTGEPVKTKAGKLARAAWQSTPAIAAAIECMDSKGDLKVISEALGEKHKVRSFYNNIAAPDAPNGDVTVDTHAVGVALLRPLSGKAAAVMQALATSPQGKKPPGWQASRQSKVTGVKGTYPIYADAYREVAEELHILPQQLQAVTWQAKRILFSIGDKKKAEVEQEWLHYHDGKQTLGQTQQNVLSIARSGMGEASPDDD